MVPSIFCGFTVLACRTSRFIEGRRCLASNGARSNSSSPSGCINKLPKVCSSNSGCKLSMFSYDALCDNCGLMNKLHGIEKSIKKLGEK